MPDAIFIVVLHITISVFSMSFQLDLAPKDKIDRVAFIHESECKSAASAARKRFKAPAAFASYVASVSGDCIKMEIKK